MNAMDAIAQVAERKIEEAIKEGLFDNLPGMGKALVIEDSHLPPDMRMACTILKNSGYLDEGSGKEGAASDQPQNMRELLRAAPPEEGRTYAKMQRLKVMLARVRRARLELDAAAPRRKSPDDGTVADALVRADDSPYLEKLLGRV